MQCLKKMIAMTKVLTPKEVQEKYHWKPTAWRKDRFEEFFRLAITTRI